MLIKGSAGIVITVSLALIFLVIGNMVYQTFTRKVVLRERVGSILIFMVKNLLNIAGFLLRICNVIE
ncbi:unnamed protein product [Thelazia callipaeda]|uniref:UPF0056 membrane protein n=1 Tax=Thelazia callipaeda TaxID=103827 RepID=A0A0N5D919_THECL|nr:unnamed protein product [Thelazia callipaeda]